MAWPTMTLYVWLPWILPRHALVVRQTEIRVIFSHTSTCVRLVIAEFLLSGFLMGIIIIIVTTTADLAMMNIIILVTLLLAVM